MEELSISIEYNKNVEISENDRNGNWSNPIYLDISG